MFSFVFTLIFYTRDHLTLFLSGSLTKNLYVLLLAENSIILVRCGFLSNSESWGDVM